MNDEADFGHEDEADIEQQKINEIKAVAKKAASEVGDVFFDDDSGLFREREVAA